MIRGYIPDNHGRGTSKVSRKDRAKRQALFDLQQGKCYWCGEQMQMNPLQLTSSGNFKANRAYATFEHLLPKAHGGTRAKENIVLAHDRCNNRRHAKKWPHDPFYGPSKKEFNKQVTHEKHLFNCVVQMVCI